MASQSFDALKTELATLLSKGVEITVGARSKKTVNIRHLTITRSQSGKGSTASKRFRSDASANPSFTYKLRRSNGDRGHVAYIPPRDYARVAAAVERGKRIVELETAISKIDSGLD